MGRSMPAMKTKTAMKAAPPVKPTVKKSAMKAVKKTAVEATKPEKNAMKSSAKVAKPEKTAMKSSAKVAKPEKKSAMKGSAKEPEKKSVMKSSAKEAKPKKSAMKSSAKAAKSETKKAKKVAKTAAISAMEAIAASQVKPKVAAKAKEPKSSLRKVVESFNIFSSKKAEKPDSTKTATPKKTETKKTTKVAKTATKSAMKARAPKQVKPKGAENSEEPKSIPRKIADSITGIFSPKVKNDDNPDSTTSTVIDIVESDATAMDVSEPTTELPVESETTAMDVSEPTTDIPVAVNEVGQKTWLGFFSPKKVFSPKKAEISESNEKDPVSPKKAEAEPMEMDDSNKENIDPNEETIISPKPKSVRSKKSNRFGMALSSPKLSPRENIDAVEAVEPVEEAIISPKKPESVASKEPNRFGMGLWSPKSVVGEPVEDKKNPFGTITEI